MLRKASTHNVTAVSTDVRTEEPFVAAIPDPEVALVGAGPDGIAGDELAVVAGHIHFLSPCQSDTEKTKQQRIFQPSHRGSSVQADRPLN